MARILVVEDDASTRGALRAGLEDVGHEVCEATNGAEALAKLQVEPAPLVVLMDLHMPGVSGFDLLRLVEEEPMRGSGHAYVLLSADDASIPVVRALRSTTVVAALAKPYDLDVLLGAIAEAARMLGDHIAEPQWRRRDDT
ncbi:MAG TPA: response regulator [Ktedonobacterales bacterium]|nr:response regulator [Ktedonobacterales bacterium]